MKYEVEVGGFVTCFRKRKLIVYASDEAEAEINVKIDDMGDIELL